MIRKSELVSSLISVLGDAGVMTGDRVHERSAGIWGPPRSNDLSRYFIPDDVLRLSAADRQHRAIGMT